jgi:hypothetical protein
MRRKFYLVPVCLKVQIEFVCHINDTLCCFLGCDYIRKESFNGPDEWVEDRIAPFIQAILKACKQRMECWKLTPFPALKLQWASL